MKLKIFFTFILYFLSSNLAFGVGEEEVTATQGMISSILGFFSTEVLLSVIFATVVIALTFLVSKIVKDRLFAYLEKTSIGESDSREELIGVITRVVNITILITGFSITLGLLGVDLGIFMGGIGFGIGFTLRTFLTNFVAGIIMVTQGVYHNGDLIKVGDDMGRIVRINSLYTTAEKLEGVIFHIPNIRFLEDNVENYHNNDKRRVDIDFLVAYDTDIKKAKAYIDKVIENFPNILKAPQYDVIVDRLDQSGLRLVVRFWMSSRDNYFQLKSNVTETINLAFKQGKISVPAQRIELMK